MLIQATLSCSICCKKVRRSDCFLLLCPRSAQLLDLYKEFCAKYPIVTIEDPFEQDDWEPAVQMTADNICQVGRMTATWRRLGWGQDNNLGAQKVLRGGEI